MNSKKVVDHIVDWLVNYSKKSNTNGFTIGISGGVDSALTSTLCAMTGLPTQIITMSIRQRPEEYQRALNHIKHLTSNYNNVSSLDIDLTNVFNVFESKMPIDIEENQLSLANARARLRMTTLYTMAQANQYLVVGTGNKVEDFGVGFFTKYGDGGVDISPIADLTKTEVWQLSEEVGVIKEIVTAKPTDGLWMDGRSDEEHLGASYSELEWAMEFEGNESDLNERESEVLEIYRKWNRASQHKIKPIPVCLIPASLK